MCTRGDEAIANVHKRKHDGINQLVINIVAIVLIHDCLYVDKTWS